MKKWKWKWRHFLLEVILQGLRGYLKYSLSYRQLVEMMLERGVSGTCALPLDSNRCS